MKGDNFHVFLIVILLAVVGFFLINGTSTGNVVGERVVYFDWDNPAPFDGEYVYVTDFGSLDELQQKHRLTSGDGVWLWEKFKVVCRITGECVVASADVAIDFGEDVVEYVGDRGVHDICVVALTAVSLAALPEAGVVMLPVSFASPPSVYFLGVGLCENFKRHPSGVGFVFQYDEGEDTDEGIRPISGNDGEEDNCPWWNPFCWFQDE